MCASQKFLESFFWVYRDKRLFLNPLKFPHLMIIAMIIPAALCLFIGLGSVYIAPLVQRAAWLFLPVTQNNIVLSITGTVSMVLTALLAGALIIYSTMRLLFKKRKNSSAVTWDCGYSLPSPSMQYTASSFTSPIINAFSRPLNAGGGISSDSRLFPSGTWSFQSSVDDWFLSGFYKPFTKVIFKTFGMMHWFQSGRIGHYVLYIALTVLSLVIWKFFL